jgi:hypothetical protein
MPGGAPAPMAQPLAAVRGDIKSDAD